MNSFSFAILLVFFFILNLNFIFGAVEPQIKPLCYSGSSLYQLAIQNCNDKDPNYGGVWYCSTIEVCEPYRNKNRECVSVRGCAKEEECQLPDDSIYDGQNLKNADGLNYLGMRTKAYCCPAHDFPDDDAIPLDYNKICNSAISIHSLSISLIVGSLLLSLFFNYF